MSVKTTRILKEVRSLFWPWCAVIAAGVVPLLQESHFAPTAGGSILGALHWIEPISFLGFVLGIPLLATLSMGNEFQHGTLPLLLSQPIGRMEIWKEKLSVMVVAVLSALSVFCYAWRSSLQEDPELWVIAGAFLIAMTASATFWTLFARSMLGGLTLNGVNSLIPLAIHERPDWAPKTMMARSLATFALLSYAGVMLWLGRRRLAQFEVTGGMVGDDLLMAGADTMPGAGAGWLRCRPTSAFLNLIRKEFRLLRPVWLISLLAVPVWIGLPVFGYTVERRSAAAVLMVLAFTPLIAVLAGTMSLGEERSWGTHSWHMTLPVSAGRQWLIKLVTAMFTGLVCAALLPVSALIADKSIFGLPLMSLNLNVGMRWLLLVALLSFASFWCACAVKGTVHAALWVFPGLLALLLAGAFGEELARWMMDFVVFRFNFFANFTFTNAVSNMRLIDTAANPMLFAALLFAPMLVFAVIQSRRLFRKQLQDSALLVLRRLLPLAATAFLCSFSLVAPYAFVDHGKRQMWTLFRETHEALEKIQTGAANLDDTHPLQLTLENLIKAAPLSESTQRWLRNSSIEVARDQPHPGGRYCCGGNSRSITFAPDTETFSYLATIHLPSGSECTVSFQAGRGNGILGGVCK
jgi:ABC-type transport system involved in multi-copper enzyme maturation permease subunit